MQTSLIFSACLLTVLLFAFTVTAEIPPGMAKATFVVHCYTVGVDALSGQPGVVSVEPGWSGAREVDRVVFNPQQVSIIQLGNWLKEADTYVSTLEASMSTEPAKEISQ
jgi:hypothetical protein